MPEDLTDAQREHRDAETAVFGANPVRNPDGSPMERGHGSRFAAMHPAAKAHFHAIETRVAVEEVLSLAKQLAAASEKLARTHKETVDSAAASKAEAAKVAATDQRISEDRSARQLSDAEIAAKNAQQEAADRRTPFVKTDEPRGNRLADTDAELS